VLADAKTAEAARDKAEAEAKAEEQKSLAAKGAEAGGGTEAAKLDQEVATNTNQRPIGPLAASAPPGKLIAFEASVLRRPGREFYKRLCKTRYEISKA
jgi:hypothetical protein